MELVAIVITLALIEYMVFGALVGRARGKYNVPAPAMNGDPVFERYNRVHQNTSELLVSFIPSIVLFGYYVRPDIAAGIGAIYLVGRIVYLKSYISDPKSRHMGAMLSMLPIFVLIIGGLIAATIELITK